MGAMSSIDIDVQELLEVVDASESERVIQVAAGRCSEEAALDHRARIAERLTSAGWITPTALRAQLLAGIQRSSALRAGAR